MTVIDIEAKSNGHLKCSECVTYWCIHVEAFVRGHYDAKEIWDNYPDNLMLEIPIVPTQNLWAKVVLYRTSDMTILNVYKVDLQFANEPDSVRPTYIGLIHPTEGRSVIRMMILDWFIGTQVTNLSSGCPGKKHGFSQEKNLLNNLKNPSMGVVEQWSIVTTGKCLACTFVPAPDLVPTSEPSGW